MIRCLALFALVGAAQGTQSDCDGLSTCTACLTANRDIQVSLPGQMCTALDCPTKTVNVNNNCLWCSTGDGSLGASNLESQGSCYTQDAGPDVCNKRNAQFNTPYSAKLNFEARGGGWRCPVSVGHQLCMQFNTPKQCVGWHNTSDYSPQTCVAAGVGRSCTGGSGTGTRCTWFAPHGKQKDGSVVDIDFYPGKGGFCLMSGNGVSQAEQSGLGAKSDDGDSYQLYMSRTFPTATPSPTPSSIPNWQPNADDAKACNTKLSCADCTGYKDSYYSFPQCAWCSYAPLSSASTKLLESTGNCISLNSPNCMSNSARFPSKDGAYSSTAWTANAFCPVTGSRGAICASATQAACATTTGIAGENFHGDDKVPVTCTWLPSFDGRSGLCVPAVRTDDMAPAKAKRYGAGTVTVYGPTPTPTPSVSPIPAVALGSCSMKCTACTIGSSSYSCMSCRCIANEAAAASPAAASPGTTRFAAVALHAAGGDNCACQACKCPAGFSSCACAGCTCDAPLATAQISERSLLRLNYRSINGAHS